MVTIARLAETAALIGDPARTVMLYAMMDGRAFTAGELAGAAGVTPQTASGHLAQLLGASMLAVEKQGRHRYFRLASTDIAAILEGLMTVTAARSPLTTGPADPGLRRARICYDHIAGTLGVALYAALLEQGHVRLAEDGVALTEGGRALLDRLGIDPPHARRPACRTCLDWSERRHHLAGQVGAAICATVLERDWLRRRTATRGLDITPKGEGAFCEVFGVSLS
jgi:DNA-binding transcriptional ArsR family regulator